MPSLHGLRCVRCRSGRLEARRDLIDCTACGTTYPVIDGIAVMFDDAVTQPGRKPEEGTARGLLEAFGLPVDAISLQRMRHAFLRGARYGRGLAGTDPARLLDEARGRDRTTDAPVTSGSAPRLRWIEEYVPRLLPPGRRIAASARIENAGDDTLRRDGPGRVTIAARWSTDAGEPIDGAESRSSLPVPVPPRRAQTMKLRLHTPEEPGRYRLELRPMRDGGAWPHDDVLTLAVQVRELPAEAPQAGWWLRQDKPASREADRQRASGLLEGWLAAHAPPEPRVLELGPGTAAIGAGAAVHHVDGDLSALQLGQVIRRHRGRPAVAICADANDLPFPPGQFDAVVVLASLHRAADPAALLAGLKRALKPGGFIAALCEPVDQSWPGHGPGHDGDEGSLTVGDYARLFGRAGLQAAEAIVDWDSLKARLLPEAAS